MCPRHPKVCLSVSNTSCAKHVAEPQAFGVTLHLLRAGVVWFKDDSAYEHDG